VLSVSMGLGMGTTAVIARAIGHGDEDRVRRLTTHSLALANTVVVVLAFVGVTTIEPLFLLLGAEPDMVPLIASYMQPWYWGVGFLVIPMVGNSAIRATGDTKTPSIVMMIAGGVNVVLDPLLIFGLGPFPRLELQGAALATVGSYVVAFAAALWILWRRERMLELRVPRLSAVVDSWRKILYIGLPATGTNLLMPLSAGILTRMVSEYGEESVAAFGVGMRLESLAMVGVSAFSMALMPFVGQNFGAGNCDRIRVALRFATRAVLGWAGGVALIYALLAHPIASLFNDETRVVELVTVFLWILPVSYGLFGTAQLVSAAFNALNQPLRSAFIVSTRLFVLAIPLAWLGADALGVTGIFAGMSVANVIIGLVAMRLVWSFLGRSEERVVADPVADAA
jgi:putative MATE family efflux protein